MAIYTQPYAVFVSPAHILWSGIDRDRRTTLLGAAAFTAALASFIPWYLWSKSKWVAGIITTGVHFAFSAKTPLGILRDLTGGGYWSSGLLLIMCVLAIVYRRSTSRLEAFLVLSATIPLVCALGADYLFDYFIAARQFLWVLPALATLAALAAERTGQIGVAIASLLILVCIYQDFHHFTAPHEDWGTVAESLAGAAGQGACLKVAPPIRPYYINSSSHN